MDFSQLSDLARNFGSGTPAPQAYTSEPQQTPGSMNRVPTFSDTFNSNSLKSFSNYVQNNANTYLDKLGTRKGIQEEALGGHGLSGVGGLAGTFIGKGAKYFDQSLERLASEMHDKGSTPEEIWKATGVRRWNSGARQEIADNTAKYKFNNFDNLNLEHHDHNGKVLTYNEAKDLYLQGKGNSVGTRTTLNRLLDHPELFKNYPDLKNTNVYIDSRLTKGNASFEPDFNTITISGDDFLDKDLSPLLHEIQHNVQAKEKWQGGGSPGSWDDSAPGQLTGYERYLRIPGEIEARMTQARQYLTDLQRRMQMPISKDVPMQSMNIHKDAYGVTK